MDKIYPVSALGRTTIPLGRQMDNGVRRILFDVTAWLQEYPGGTIALYVMPPMGDGYPAKIDMEGSMAAWTITGGDTAHAGHGMLQLVLMGKNGEKLHSANAPTMIESSAAANAGSEPPNAAKPWFDQIMDLLNELKNNGVSEAQIAVAVEAYLAKHPIEGVTQEALAQAVKAINEQIADKVGKDQLNTAVNSALTQAKESGEFDGPPGKPGYTPQKGIDYFDGAPGAPGEPGKDYTLTEEDKQEIAAKVPVPTALPNPFPLTINGTAYDGSKAVSMTVEGGAGGGEANTQFRLIREVVIPEDVASDTSGVAFSEELENGGVYFAFDTDKDGNPFELSELLIVSVASSTYTGAISPVFGGGTTPVYGGKYLSTMLTVGKSGSKTYSWSMTIIDKDYGSISYGVNFGGGNSNVQSAAKRTVLDPDYNKPFPAINQNGKISSIRSWMPNQGSYGYEAGSSFMFFGR